MFIQTYFKGRVARFGAVALCLLSAITSSLAAQYFAPEAGKGPAVLLISGAGGPTSFRWYAMDIAKLGYTAVLVAGKDVSATGAESAQNLRKEIADLQTDRRVVPGRVAVVGFSQGGGGAMLHATVLPERISAVVAYYPAITRVPDLEAVGKRVSVPTLVLAGEKDSYFNCCLVESMRALAAGATAGGAPLELVVYPAADHGFNLDGPRYRPDDSADAWERTKAHLAKFHPAR
jgi:dienelactone hydrolase